MLSMSSSYYLHRLLKMGEGVKERWLQQVQEQCYLRRIMLLSSWKRPTSQCGGQHAGASGPLLGAGGKGPRARPPRRLAGSGGTCEPAAPAAPEPRQIPRRRFPWAAAGQDSPGGFLRASGWAEKEGHLLCLGPAACSPTPTWWQGVLQLFAKRWPLCCPAASGLAAAGSHPMQGPGCPRPSWTAWLWPQRLGGLVGALLGEVSSSSYSSVVRSTASGFYNQNIQLLLSPSLLYPS